MTNKNIFDLFNVVDARTKVENEEKAAIAKNESEKKAAQVELEKKQREEKIAEIMKNKSNTEVSKSENTKAAKKEVVFAPNESTIIRYFGEEIEINKYFSAEELAEGLLVKKKDVEPSRKPLEPEMLRQRMEKDFPELIKSHTEIVFLEKKNIIVPIMQAKKKGNYGSALSSDSTSLSLPKIPFSVLFEFISLAKKLSELNLEVHADIYYDRKKSAYFLYVPHQKVHTYWVLVDEDSLLTADRTEGCAKVLEIHSHHNMEPIASPTDDAGDIRPGYFYAIVGRNDKYFPDITLRQYISKEIGHISIPLNSVFECPFPFQFDLSNLDIEVCAE